MNLSWLRTVVDLLSSVLQDTPPEPTETTMILKEWNVWHTYSTHMRAGITNLPNAAELLVDSGVFDFAMTQDGQAWWRDGAELKASRIYKEPASDDSVSVQFPKEMPSYAMECALQASLSAIYEERLYPDLGGTRPPFLRAFAGEMSLTLQGRQVLLYPQVKLYADGVILLHFRVLSGTRHIDVAELVDVHVNLFRHSASSMSAPPELVRRYLSLMTALEMRWWNLLKRRGTAAVLDQLVKKNTRQVPGAFGFTACEISADFFNVGKRATDPPLGLRLLSQMLEYCIADTVFGSPRAVERQTVRQQRMGNIQGRAWTGRPSVYLLDYIERPRSARSAVTRFRHELAKIMLRASAQGADDGQALGSNLRSFDDYALFLNSALYLFVVADLETVRESYWPKTGDPTLGFILEKQLAVEHAEYVSARHYQLRDQADAPQGALRDIVNLERRIDDLEHFSKAVTQYGELREVFQYADSQREHRATRERIQQSVRRKNLELTDLNERRVWLFGTGLTLLLGLSVVTDLTAAVVMPALKIVGAPMSQDPEVAQLTATAATAGAMISILGLLYLVLLARRPKV